MKPVSARAARVVLAIGGFDPSCGAGVVADARSIESFGLLPAAVVTAITVQAGRGVGAYRAVAPQLVRAQLATLLATLPVHAIKIGQVPTVACARVLASALSRVRVPIVIDPVTRASGGGRLATGTGSRVPVRALFRHAAVLTANLAEAAAFTGTRVDDEASMRRAASMLATSGCRAVVVKGGHLAGAPRDVLWHGGRTTCFRGSRIRSRGRLPADLHGSGCAFASAVAAALARGDGVRSAVVAARAHVRELIAQAIEVADGAVLRAPRAR